MTPLERIIEGRKRDLGGFTVRRVLPFAKRRMVGPFIFFDEMGPQELPAGTGIDVRPHPHICLSTVTYLFDGELLHRDSLGTVQRIRPGEVNWMTAGRGIVHSERTPADLRKTGTRAFGIQVWVAHPTKDEEVEPGFAHHAAEALPVVQDETTRIRVIVGELFGARSPVRVLSPMFYAEVILQPGARLTLQPEYEERAVYVAEGTVAFEADGGDHVPGQMLVLAPNARVVVRNTGTVLARLMLIGGAPLDGERHIEWNFVASTRARIEQAKADWKAGRFPPVPGETEFIPLPETGPLPEVRYP